MGEGMRKGNGLERVDCGGWKVGWVDEGKRNEGGVMNMRDDL